MWLNQKVFEILFGSIIGLAYGLVVKLIAPNQFLSIILVTIVLIVVVGLYVKYSYTRGRRR